MIQLRQMRWQRWALVSALLTQLPFAAVAGQIAQSGAAYPVRGTVVNSITGEAIRGALVQIYTNRQRSVLTGADGKFVFADVPAGTVNVTVQKPGFFPPQAIQSPRAQATFAVSGPDQPPLVLKLVPEGVISGHITGDGGEPVEELPVQLLAERVENGKKSRANIHTANTDEEGEFRMAELPPGKYFVFVGPTTAQQIAYFDGLPSLQTDVRGYPGTFYPDVPDIAAANQVEIAAGQHVEVNFNLRTQPFHRISGTISGYPRNAGYNLQVINAAGQQMPAGFRFDQRDGTFRSVWLAAGTYTLTAETRDPEGGREYFASQSVNLTSDVVGVHLQLLPGLNIPVNSRLEKTRADSPATETQTFSFVGRAGRMVRQQVNVPASVVLTQENGAFSQQQQRDAQIVEGEDSRLEIPGVPPGVYTVRVIPNGPWYVQSAFSGSLNLLEQNLTVAAGSAVQPIEIVLRDDFAQLHGSVAMGAGNDSATVIAIPESGQPRMQGIALAPGYETQRAAEFEMGQLAPGTYRVLAVDRGDDFEYGNPEVLRKYLSKAREISLSANQQGKVELELVHVGE